MQITLFEGVIAASSSLFFFSKSTPVTTAKQPMPAGCAGRQLCLQRRCWSIHSTLKQKLNHPLQPSHISGQDHGPGDRARVRGRYFLDEQQVTSWWWHSRTMAFDSHLLQLFLYLRIRVTRYQTLFQCSGDSEKEQLPQHQQTSTASSLSFCLSVERKLFQTPLRGLVSNHKMGQMKN